MLLSPGRRRLPSMLRAGAIRRSVAAACKRLLRKWGCFYRNGAGDAWRPSILISTLALCEARDEVNPQLNAFFAEEYRAIRPRSPMPPIEVRFRRFTSLNTTIRLRDGKIRVSLSDLLEGAAEPVLRAIAHILLAKLYRKPIDGGHASRYRRFTTSEAVVRQSERIRQTRGRKKILSARGDHYDLEEVFETLNRQFFHGLM